MPKYTIWEGDPPDIHSMLSLRKASETNEDKMHIVVTFEAETPEAAREVFDEYSHRAWNHGYHRKPKE